MSNWKSRNVEPLPPHTTKELRYILEGIRDGKLEHDQSEWHCGTAHCVGGWKEFLDFKAKKQKRSFFTVAPIGSLEGLGQKDDYCVIFESDYNWGYSQEDWGLSDREANALFQYGATLKEQFKVLEKLEAGKRYFA